VLDNDGTRKDGFSHEAAVKLEAAKEKAKIGNAFTEAETVVLYAEADAKQRGDAHKGKYTRGTSTGRGQSTRPR
jgi:hypothetical protein